MAEYALQDETKPMGISAYELAEALPGELKTNLPTIEQIEQELAKGRGARTDRTPPPRATITPAK